VSVAIQGEGRKGMAEHPLHGLHRGPGRDRERSRGVPQLLRVEAGPSDPTRRSVEVAAPEVADPEVRPLRRRKDQILRSPPLDLGLQAFQQKCALLDRPG
jgi:hypothetical protein